MEGEVRAGAVGEDGMLLTEVCPYEDCGATIRVSCGVRPCPVCGGLITVRPDWSAIELLRLLVQAVWGWR